MIYTHKKISFMEYLRSRKNNLQKNRFYSKYNNSAKNYLKTFPDNKYLACFLLDGTTPSILQDSLFDVNQIECIFSYLKNNNLINGCAIDAGASFGTYSLYFSKYFDHVYSFEPHPISFSILNINVKYCNPKQNITTFNYGLSSKESVRTLYDWKNFSPSGSTFNTKSIQKNAKGQNAKGHHFECKLKPLKEKDFSDKKIGFLKIDVENYEMEVLLGAEELIKKQKPVILIEDWKSREKKESDKIKFLRTLGYNYFLTPQNIPHRANNPILAKTKYLMQLLFNNGQSYGLVECDFSNPKGYAHILCYFRKIT